MPETSMERNRRAGFAAGVSKFAAMLSEHHGDARKAGAVFLHGHMPAEPVPESRASLSARFELKIADERTRTGCDRRGAASRVVKRFPNLHAKLLRAVQ